MKKICIKHNIEKKQDSCGHYRCIRCNKERVIISRKNKKIKLVKLFGGKCYRCGYCKSYKALQFHHINPKEKDFTISQLDCSFEKSKKEASKCILVCANCHAEIEEDLDNGVIV